MKKILIIMCFAFIINCNSSIYDRGDAEGTGIIVNKLEGGAVSKRADFKYQYEITAVFCNVDIYSNENYNVGDRITFKPIKVEVKK